MQFPDKWSHCHVFVSDSLFCQRQGLEVLFVEHCQGPELCGQLHTCWFGHCQLTLSPSVCHEHVSSVRGHEHIWTPVSSVNHCQDGLADISKGHLQVADELVEWKSQGQSVKNSQFGLAISLCKEWRLKNESQLNHTHSWTTFKLSSSQEHRPSLSGKNACLQAQLFSRSDETDGQTHARLFLWFL